MIVLTLALLLLGLGLLVVEAHLPTYGVLGAAGVIAFGAGVALAIRESGGGLALALGVALPVAAGALTVGGLAVHKTLAASRRRARCGADELIGHVGVVRRSLDPLGHVAIDGELWRARRSWVDEAEPPPAEGEAVVVERVQGLTLSVRRAESWEGEL
jgi:membrane-bound ClpP family serine protease